MKSLEDFYKGKAFECREKADGFGYYYWMLRAYEISCLEVK